jgi:hypothetical protein
MLNQKLTFLIQFSLVLCKTNKNVLANSNCFCFRWCLCFKERYEILFFVLNHRLERITPFKVYVLNGIINCIECYLNG